MDEGFLDGLLTCPIGALDASKVCSDLVTCLSGDPNTASQVGEILARLASEESFRVQAGKSEILPALLPFLRSPELSTRLQVLRAIGNLCIDNDDNREVVLSAGGCQTLAEQIDKCSDTSSEEFSSDRYKCVACGCILNLAADNEKLSQSFLREGVLEKICSLLRNADQPSDVIRYGLKTLCAIVENAGQESLESPIFLESILHLLRCANQKECDDVGLLLELVKAVVEKEGEGLSIKLVEIGIPKELLQVDQTEFQQQAMDILVLLLGKDDCMEALFNDGETLAIAKGWLEGTHSSSQLRMANAALIIANLARSDSNCLSLVESGVVPLLMALIKLEETEVVEGKLHFAALSALRNLSLPTHHKEMFFSMGVLDCAIHALKMSTTSHVQYKAIGLMRLLAENQASTGAYVIREAMERLCEVCDESGISHVHIETGRLFSLVVKHCQDRDILLKITKEGGLKWIYRLLQSDQPQLIGEGLLAINIIVRIFEDEALSVLNEEPVSISSCLCSILTSSVPLNLINNSLVLVETLLKNSDLLKNDTEVKQAVQNLMSHENEEIALKSKAALSHF